MLTSTMPVAFDDLVDLLDRLVRRPNRRRRRANLRDREGGCGAVIVGVLLRGPQRLVWPRRRSAGHSDNGSELRQCLPRRPDLAWQRLREAALVLRLRSPSGSYDVVELLEK
jgi:hypothetical protein